MSKKFAISQLKIFHGRYILNLVDSMSKNSYESYLYKLVSKNRLTK